MASVGSPSERSNRDDEIRRNRETYQQRETETAKKQSQQLKTISQSHADEVEGLKEAHSKQLEELKDRTKDALTRRDVQYQKEMEDLRELHQKQLQRLSTDAETRQQRLEENLRGENERVGKTAQQQREILKGTYETQLKEKDQRFDEFTKTALKTQSEDLLNTRKKITQNHNKELETVIKDRDQRIGDEQRQSRETRKAKDDQIKQLERMKRNEVDRLMSGHKLSIEGERENHAQATENQREVLEMGLRKERERFEEAERKRRDEFEESRDGLSQTVNDRLNSRLRVLEGDYQKIKEDQPRLRNKLEQQKAVELTNLRNALGKNIQQLEESRRATVKETNAKTQDEIGKLNKTNTSLVNRQNRFYQDKLALDTARADERLMKKEGDAQKVLNNEKVSSQTRFEKLKTSMELDQDKTRSFFERATTSMRENFENTLREMRDRNKRDQDAMFAQFNRESQETDAKFQQKIGEVSTRYEKQIAVMQDENLKTLKDQQAISERQKNELIKKNDLELKTQASQYQYKLAKTEEHHKREIEALQQRHQETLANLTKNRQT